MLKLLALYFGTVILMYLSQVYHPAPAQLGRSSGQGSRPRMDIFMGIAVFWLASFMFLRTNYNDTTAYIGGFLNSVSPGEFFASGQLSDLTGNPLFYFYNCLVRSITDNYHLFFLLPSFLISYSCINLFKRYSVFPAATLLICFSVGTPIVMMTAMKQGIATSILLLSIPYALDRKYIRFYLLVALASQFHTYAIVFAIIPLLCGAPWGKQTWILLGITIFFLLTFDGTMGAVIDQLQEIGAHASEEDVFNNTKINILRVAVYLVPAMLAITFRHRLFHDSSRTENLFTNISILSGFSLTLGLADGSNIMARVAAYFEIGTAVCLPWMINKLFKKCSAQFVTCAAAVLYFGYFLYEFAITKDFGNQYSAITLWEFIESLF